MPTVTLTHSLIRWTPFQWGREVEKKYHTCIWFCCPTATIFIQSLSTIVFVSYILFSPHLLPTSSRLIFIITSIEIWVDIRFRMVKTTQLPFCYNFSDFNKLSIPRAIFMYFGPCGVNCMNRRIESETEIEITTIQLLYLNEISSAWLELKNWNPNGGFGESSNFRKIYHKINLILQTNNSNWKLMVYEALSGVCGLEHVSVLYKNESKTNYTNTKKKNNAISMEVATDIYSHRGFMLPFFLH